MIRQVELVELVKSYDPNSNEDALNRAYVFSMKAHGSQKRASGDPYFLHPLEVAGILTDYRLDTSTIITALLHDTIEDTLATQEEVEGLFGDEIGALVDGVTKLTRIEMQSDHAKQAENFRKLLLAMSEDIRVLLVKLADRLHNMRTLHFIKKEDKRRRIAMETMEIYAPLAERIGMQEMKNELEDLAFAQINPEARDSIVARLDFLRKEGSDLIVRIEKELKKTLEDGGLKDVMINGREKLPYSIWRKMQHKDVSFEQLSDIMAFRIIVPDVNDIYKALGVLHDAYRVVPGRFKDYISTPKPNGYRSLHTGVLGPEQHRIEIQLRTGDMHEIAENGVAAHWTYKQGKERTEGRQYRWIRELLDILEHATGPEDFLEHTKMEMFQDQVFCFTPNGDLINMTHGATAVDFAYAVHSEVGDRCVGAKINGRIMPLRTVLTNGDQVEILTSKAQTPSPTWERFVVTGKARARIRRFIHSKEREQYLQLGRAILQRAFREEGYEFTDKALKGVLKVFQQDTPDDLTAQIGAGHVGARDVVEAVFPAIKKKKKSKKGTPLSKAKGKKSKGGSDTAIPIRGLIPGMAVHYAGCCHPLPGDRIVGIISTGKGVTIHTIDCDKLESFVDEPDRWLDVSWQQESELPDIHVGRIHLTVTNEPGVLGTLSMVIGKSDGNISNLKITNRSSEFYDLLIDIEVHDVKHLADIIAALRATPSINAVERAKG
ncbi:MAG: bifunctional (p)ppGpp synthetase/guanosine-3',5'-bis(diphosphate) 3'-pyrophosphohydrolase [Rhodospirillaceae bacterium]|jgi:GTP diphosphokinase / guanosine-3',5'-bis(diphosphate) 3'-diphosphatase|nr:bifunctional (p)ppGpp synthetase/guanosine-3',5'-bis(diphosphate) 3'-pyrophosphohydrolase [Rhodospirillaceae bacterium]MBT4219359.1 bifunctional (p)ppGpp synthetase/guanosine-3',5'-bis(diphosphate) 3'-pyrophosphohydrolase [Rhodospirillaceae bacterium]MBT4464720.1 bifunctional (p)ppGpp synthetase/guanosine-3',5'-bis(diphosphate) 3'-pyrophosphohydrolase [Rhodospirillaceae bacterium]MBT5014508.1 bifunctional (p)ppGpp synthetase/guanosine-3',5'-bis(diphosphate) 3'-pyrophosphohydrolase [Rhodospiri